MRLDEHQRKAVEHSEGPALVVAGPGSGKTTVIKERILNLVNEHNVDPANILAIAFTNAAVDEMGKKLEESDLKGKPTISTLHAFGNEFIANHYHRLGGFSEKPHIWDNKKIKEIIDDEKNSLKRKTRTAKVYIYTFENTRTGQCYIGQTRDMERREQEHRMHSSNRRLREALQQCQDEWVFREIDSASGATAYDGASKKEKDWIEHYENRSVVNLVPGNGERRNDHVTIYKIQSLMDVTTYIGYTTDSESIREIIDPERFECDIIHTEIPWTQATTYIENEIEKHYENRSVVNLVPGMEQAGINDRVTIYKIRSSTDATLYIGYTTDSESIREIIDPERFECDDTEIPWTQAATYIESEIVRHKNWAVFNRQDPEKARFRDQLRIEIFCELFNVPYDKVLEHPEQFENLMAKFDDFKDDIEKEKRQVREGTFDPNEIDDLVLRAFATKYEARKTEAGAIDFLDMLILPAHILKKHSDLRQKYCDKYRYVFVDEFQDISPADFRLIDLLSDESQNLFAVGDDDQAIFGFRGGDSSIMQGRFGNREDVTRYEITRNYRSTSTIVRHSKALIEHNSGRIPKNLRAANSAVSRVEVLERSNETIKNFLLKELSNLKTDVHEIGILARNWNEINRIQGILDCEELRIDGFEVDWEELDDPWENLDDPDQRKRRIMILRRGTQEIEVLNIHNAKGKEWDKVILFVNVIRRMNNKPTLPDDRDDITDERRLFYVAVTRAKRELVILDGGDCEFISEFRNVPPLIEKEAAEQVVGIYLDRLLFGFRTKYQLTNINKPSIIRKMGEYLLSLDEKSVEEIRSFASRNIKSIDRERQIDYFGTPLKIDRCTPIFRDFWKRMWEVVK